MGVDGEDARMSSSPNWRSRYRDGDRDQVWHELRQLGATIRQSDLVEEAQLVCDEMASRARRNIEIIVERLLRAGYRTHSNRDDQTPQTPYFPPSATACDHAAWLEATFGPIPMTLLAWARLVGDVWLVGTHPEWPTSAAADPLVIEVEGSRYPDASIRASFVTEHESWRDWTEQDGDAGPFVLPVAPDRLHKDNVSGGPPYGIIVPDGCADGLFVAETPMPFVSYLNWVFRNGGFPWHAGSDDNAWRVRHDLAKDLLLL
jgi:hypothetical protein